MSEPLRLLINGAAGRMGTAIIQAAKGDSTVQISERVTSADDFATALGNCDVAIDFTHANATAEVLEQCQQARRPLALGTTGQSDEVRALIEKTSHILPIVFAPNFSIGVNTLFWLTKKAAEILGPDYDLEIVEMHHRLKKDAPSGTARRLAEILADVRQLQYSTDIRHGREGLIGERSSTEIGLHAVRGGDIVGDHTVLFADEGERLELTHKATNRTAFARGSIQAAKWLVDRAPGLYSMEDVLGLW